jgi:hypothetical protein
MTRRYAHTKNNCAATDRRGWIIILRCISKRRTVNYFFTVLSILHLTWCAIISYPS